jgi:hypothetical protein
VASNSLQVYAYHVVVVYVILGIDSRIGPFDETTKIVIALLAIASLIIPAWVHANYANWMEGVRLTPQLRASQGAAQGHSRN